MLVYIMRHGEAESLAGRDKERQLTPLGSSECALVGRWLSALQPKIDYVLSSPYVRAQQSLEAVKTSWHFGHAVEETHEYLIPAAHAEQAAGYLWELANAKAVSSVLVLSHMPLVSFLVEALDSAKQSPIFWTSGVACLELDIETQMGALKWIKAPNECR
ncbi:phosphohistidine phosphatase SixA [Echinimonas agarilytica]|uniref:Phosphohistidine phosphatase SixA n=1 Tax=Echinimonas agarilytica TaxID=1215918 RepID=A0AA41W5G9_9GAMM|nr:phosphohistidine phosphatase SixA [Echinimonas agarilytica]MCM2679230.1 phosphohistidine phosphatase SixA [Echinimonas agarilytica]